VGIGSALKSTLLFTGTVLKHRLFGTALLCTSITLVISINTVMYSSTLLASLALLSSTFASPLSTTVTPTKTGPISKAYDPLLDPNNANSTMSILASCSGGSNENTADIESMGNWLQGQSGTFYAPHLSQTSWTLGSIKLCVDNNYLTENTHVSYWEAGWGALSVKNACCFNQYCGGGKCPSICYEVMDGLLIKCRVPAGTGRFGT
jgi:hypothetical protein